MDRDHRLDAPDNESLSTIEQLSDHSDLTTIYPHAHQEWEGVEIMSRDAREKKLTEEQLRISLSLRKYFVPIGILLPLPFIVLPFLATFTAKFLDIGKIGFLMLPALIGMGVILFALFRLFRYAYRIFYKHGTRALPFIIALFGLLALSTNAAFLLSEPLHTGEYFIDSLFIGATMLVLSVLYSGILVIVWTSPRLTAGWKIAIVGLIALVVAAGTAALNLL